MLPVIFMECPNAGFSANLLKITRTFAQPSPIQAQCWPIIQSGADLVGIAATGSGKTLAFGLPGLKHILAQKAAGVTTGTPCPSSQSGVLLYISDHSPRKGEVSNIWHAQMSNRSGILLRGLLVAVRQCCEMEVEAEREGAGGVAQAKAPRRWCLRPRVSWRSR